METLAQPVEKQEAVKAPIIAAECMQMIKAWRVQMRAETSALQKRSQDSSRELYLQEKSRLEHSFICAQIQKIIAEAERYRHLFFTERGSFYFVLKTGESMRLKATLGAEGKSVFLGDTTFNPLMRGIAFIDQSELVKQKDVLDYLEFHNSATLQTVALGEGCIPFEYEPLEWVGRRAHGETEGIVEWDEVCSRLTLRGWADAQGERPPSCFNGYPTHMGHPVKRVLV